MEKDVNSESHHWQPRTIEDYNNLYKKIFSFKQHVNETFHGAWDRYKTIIQGCHGPKLPLWQQAQVFYEGLNFLTKQILDEAAGGSIDYIASEEAYELLEKMSMKGNGQQENISPSWKSEDHVGQSCQPHLYTHTLEWSSSNQQLPKYEFQQSLSQEPSHIPADLLTEQPEEKEKPSQTVVDQNFEKWQQDYEAEQQKFLEGMMKWQKEFEARQQGVQSSLQKAAKYLRQYKERMMEEDLELENDEFAVAMENFSEEEYVEIYDVFIFLKAVMMKEENFGTSKLLQWMKLQQKPYTIKVEQPVTKQALESEPEEIEENGQQEHEERDKTKFELKGKSVEEYDTQDPSITTLEESLTDEPLSHSFSPHLPPANALKIDFVIGEVEEVNNRAQLMTFIEHTSPQFYEKGVDICVGLRRLKWTCSFKHSVYKLRRGSIFPFDRG